MSAEIDIPTHYTIDSNIDGSMDMGLDDIRIKELPKIQLSSDSKLTSDSKLSSDSKLTSDSKVDMGLDDIRIRELPKIQIEASMKPTRIHFPVNMKFGLCAMGTELVSFTICGESMTVIEDYTPHHTEQCR